MRHEQNKKKTFFITVHNSYLKPNREQALRRYKKKEVFIFEDPKQILPNLKLVRVC